MGKVCDQVIRYKRKFPGSIIWWRYKKHAKVVENHLNPGEIPMYSFAAQMNDNPFDLFSTAVLCMTNRRLLVGQDHIIGGYTLKSITPDLFNDLTVYRGFVWGKITIDTLKEEVIFTNVEKKALREIETAITTGMMEEKKEYGSLNSRSKK